MTREIVTDDDLSPVVEVITWTMYVFTALTVLTRLGIKLRVLKRTNLDDATIVASLVFATIQSILVSVAASHGAGTTVSRSNASDIELQEKALYTSDLFFVLSCACAKASLVNFISNLGASQTSRNMAKAIQAFLALWAVSSIFALAFACGIPQPWAFITKSCASQRPIQVYVGIVNALTDTVLTAWPLWLIAGVQIPLRKRISVSVAFLGRLSVVATVICQIVFRYTQQRSDDISLSYTPVILTTQIAQCLSIASTCAVYLKPFLDSLESGFINVGDLRRKQSEGFGYSPKRSKLFGTLQSISGRVRGHSAKGQSVQLQTRKTSTADALIEEAIPEESTTSKSDRSSDVTKEASNGNAIVQTREWTVDYSQRSRNGSRA